MSEKYMSADEAVKLIESGNRVFIHSVAAAPQQLIKAMVNRADELRNVEIVHLHTEGEAPYVKSEYKDSFFTKCLFIGGNVRSAFKEGRADYIPVFLSEAPILFRRGILPLDIALMQVSPPDKHGFCSLGTSVDTSRAAVQVAKYVIAQVNPQMPRTHGQSLIHVDQFDALVNVDEPIFEMPSSQLTEVEIEIGKNVATVIEDQACLQMGIGAIPDAVLAQLGRHRDLGIHTEMFSDGVLPLVESGVVTNKYKGKHPGKMVVTFVLGTRKLYDFLDDNPLVEMLDCSYVNDTHIIRQNKKTTAINSAIEIDITGQVCADSIGTRMYSGVGGQMDFIRGASLAEDGKAIIALPSVTRRGESRIVPFLKEGAGVVTTRAHVHFIATEYGIVDLYGKSLTERAKALISIAHPDHREKLEREAWERFHSENPCQ